MIREVKTHSKIDVMTDARITGFSGYKGNFVTQVQTGEGWAGKSATVSPFWPPAPVNISPKNLATAQMAAS